MCTNTALMLFFARHAIISPEAESLMAMKLSTDLFHFCENTSLYWETFSGLWKAICSPAVEKDTFDGLLFI